MEQAVTPLAISDSDLQERREKVFLALAGVFICAMTMLNIIGSTRFIELGPMALTVGVLPYPITFLCTDLICELFGKKRANYLVTVGLFLNFFILGIITLAHSATPVPGIPWHNLQLVEPVVGLPGDQALSGTAELFDFIYIFATGTVFASMFAYVAAQYIDVRLFHFWKRLTKGKHLWLRNNFSTLLSQAVDSVLVIGIVFWGALARGEITLQQYFTYMASSYLFKMFAALLDTIPFYILTAKLKRYLHVDRQYSSQTG
ncbi:queuosine precursor transporter [Halioxenophilus sp. WMMB6]|uniref:queuosine precursor transporter n=1 Tax=Halioxenophilus sp. WMMB6 TaxID=3073815 RepID=UPI00295E3D8E|nr:queuosine precursor transporter [Halioxenophilus sp. WMMB6]